MGEPPGTSKTFDVGEHVAAFNSAVASGRWESFVARFTHDAVMEFEGVPAGPFVGADDIGRAYAESPPDDTIADVEALSADGDEVVVAFRWCDSGAPGTMRFTPRDGLVSRLIVTFG